MLISAGSCAVADERSPARSLRPRVARGWTARVRPNGRSQETVITRASGKIPSSIRHQKGKFLFALKRGCSLLCNNDVLVCEATHSSAPSTILNRTRQLKSQIVIESKDRVLRKTDIVLWRAAIDRAVAARLLAHRNGADTALEKRFNLGRNQKVGNEAAATRLKDPYGLP